METYSRFPQRIDAQTSLDEGLRRHMLGIYRYMGIGLAVTGLVAMGIAATPALAAAIFGTPLKWVAMLAPLAFILFFTFRIDRMTVGTARTAFYAFAAVMGVSMASIFLVFTGISIANAFFTAAAMFAGMSLLGYTTRRDLTGMGSFLMVGLVAIIVVSLINIFLGSSLLQIVISIVGVAIFAGLTAWDTQRLKSEYLEWRGHEAVEKMAVMGALSLYLNFVNMFQFLLGLMGPARELINALPQCPELRGRCGISRCVKTEIMITRPEPITAPPRAVRLHIEARNCLDIAIGKEDSSFAGELIDEAIRLERRARELAAAANDPGKFR